VRHFLPLQNKAGHRVRNDGQKHDPGKCSGFQNSIRKEALVTQSRAAIIYAHGRDTLREVFRGYRAVTT
jgi:hypothetical protein